MKDMKNVHGTWKNSWFIYKLIPGKNSVRRVIENGKINTRKYNNEPILIFYELRTA